ncbi:hypothetical protein D3C81_1571130 [compost metagenome]
MRVHLRLIPEGRGGRLLVHVEDSGKGFDLAAALACPPSMDSLCGRGLILVSQLTARCEPGENGKGIRVEFRWPTQA